MKNEEQLEKIIEKNTQTKPRKIKTYLVNPLIISAAYATYGKIKNIIYKK